MDSDRETCCPVAEAWSKLSNIEQTRIYNSLIFATFELWKSPLWGRDGDAGTSKLTGPGREKMAMEKTKKCAHPNCSCSAMAGKYCCVQCESMEKMPDLDCKCGHPACKGKIE
jgi:metallothionein